MWCWAAPRISRRDFARNSLALSFIYERNRHLRLYLYRKEFSRAHARLLVISIGNHGRWNGKTPVVKNPGGKPAARRVAILSQRLQKRPKPTKRMSSTGCWPTMSILQRCSDGKLLFLSP